MSVIEYLLEQQAVVMSVAAIGGLIGLAILLLIGTFTVRLVRGYLAAQQQKRTAKQEQALAKRRQQELAEKRARQKKQAARARRNRPPVNQQRPRQKSRHQPWSWQQFNRPRLPHRQSSRWSALPQFRIPVPLKSLRKQTLKFSPFWIACLLMTKPTPAMKI